MAAVNPAVGARGQIGISQEGSWGSKQNAPTHFFEMVNETIVSELGSLVSNALRPDRAVHKRIGGVESAGGDVNVEVSASGLGKLFKHALGSVVTTRLDHAFVLKVTDAGVTSAVLTVTTASGLATNFAVVLTGGSGSGVDLDLTSASYDTIQEVMDAINAGGTGLHAYSVTSYQASGDSTTIGASDYAVATDNSNKLEGVTAVELIKNPTGNKDFLVSFAFGAYQHVIDASATLPQGLTFEVGRDVAAFTYSGCKVNTMTLTADTGEILGGTFGIMAKGATTASRAVADSGNTGNAKNAFGIKYTGAGTCTFTIDKSNHHINIESSVASEDLDLDISVPWINPTTGVVYPVHTLGGLVAYLNSLSYITCTISDYASLDADCSHLAAVGPTDIAVTTLVVHNFDTTNVVSEPVTWGDYYTNDAGVAQNIIAEIVDSGVPGVATVKFKAQGGADGSTYTTSATVPTQVRIASNVDTKFTIFFPDGTSLQSGDKWTISSFKLAETASAYPTLDPFAGFDGALTIDGSSQGIMGWNCTLNNNLFPEKYHLGDRVRGALPEQRRTTEGSVNVEFDNLDLYRRFLNGTSGNLVMTFTSDTYISTTALGNSLTQYQLIIRQPNMEFNGTTPTVADEGIITVDMPYVALFDDTNSIPELRVTLVNNTAYL